MRIRSTSTRYGSVAIALHWSIAALIGTALASGFAADTLGAHGTNALRVHVTTGITAAVLTLARLLWWWTADVRPEKLDGPAAPLATAIHVLLQLLPLGLATSGVTILALADAFPVLAGGGLLPDFGSAPPRALHGLAARLLIGLIVLHVSAALYHHYRLRDGCLVRMGIAPRTGA
ncbi:cytochrome b [Amorphus orientalis]|uniref:Cytochrome b561 n=1 Tax=Amorphus orientalis TaxID=649198 RepID=A0AAE3VQE2_9HYPH|nr:cytochrome b/b6 domain-containing protein [Amorphus orientalis]MDQ0316222.1 cytochrome b561 [Amorphus orientalis]